MVVVFSYNVHEKFSIACENSATLVQHVFFSFSIILSSRYCCFLLFLAVFFSQLSFEWNTQICNDCLRRV